jgi:valyl-tRNA synthetase
LENPKNNDISYYYPTTVLVTAPDIIFFWVARMIMAGYEYRREKPFHHVYFTGMVRDKQRRKMSKSLGNSPEPLDLIAKYGADGVRVGMLLASPAGNDLLFEDKLCEQGRNFCNKIWNALRLVKGWDEATHRLPPNPLKPARLSGGGEPQPMLDPPLSSGAEPTGHSFRGPGGSEGSEGYAIAIRWFESRLNQTIHELNAQFEDYNLSEALKTLYSFIWDDFCSWYLEFVKPQKGEAIDQLTLDKTIEFFEKLMRLLHPFMPFITEEVRASLQLPPWEGVGASPGERARPELVEGGWDEASIMVSKWPEAGQVDEAITRQAAMAMQVITGARDIRNKSNLKNPDTIAISVETDRPNSYEAFIALISKLTNATTFDFSTGTEGAAFLIGSDKVVVRTGQATDPAAERERLQKELDYTLGFIRSIESKLNNRKFVDGAPAEVVERERTKLRDGQEKLRSIEEALSSLN